MNSYPLDSTNYKLILDILTETLFKCTSSVIGPWLNAAFLPELNSQ
jgi:hypothetical protein